MSIVSVVIPTKNSGQYLAACLKSIGEQTYRDLEVIIIDGHSTDNTLPIAKEFNCKIFQYSPRVAEGVFDAPHKRNYGVKKARGEFVYYVDADMKLQKNVIKECVESCQNGFDAVIIHEDSFGKGKWAQAKNLERQCYWGDDLVEAPRFIKKKAWVKVGGLDEQVGGGGDDWDLFQKLTSNGYKVTRIKSLVLHNEGDLKLGHLIKKRFMYGSQTFQYVKKRPKNAVASYFPIRKSYIKNWRLFLSRPKDSFYFIIMRSAEYSAGFAGLLYSTVKK